MQSASLIIGSYIKNVRIKKELSINALSRIAGISASQISLIEHGIHPKNGKALSITLSSLEMIAKGLEITVQEILEESGYYDFENTRILAKITSINNASLWITHYYALNNENKVLVNNYIDELLEKQTNESSYSR